MTSRHRTRRPLQNAARAAFRGTIEMLEPRAVLAAAALGPASPQPGVEPLDGVGNNIANPQWGSTAERLLRLSPPAFADGVSLPAGGDRPSARVVSNLLAQSPSGGLVNDRDWTAFAYAWGQFLDHDIGLTDTASPREAFPIAVPAGDPSFDPTGTGTKTIAMSRSAWDPTTGTSPANPRQQVNAITAFIDGSQVYGSDDARAAALREFIGGRLRTSAGGLLPVNTGGLPNANDAHRVADDTLFLAGDVRANENPELLALHTLFVREHNRLAAEAAARNPSWNDERLFQHARRIVIAELQKITYDEFLPALLGGPRPGADGIPPYGGYRTTVNPGIATEFSTAAFRVGHSMLGDDIQFLDGSGADIREPMLLRDAFFDPRPIASLGIDGVLKYLASDRGQEIDTRVVDDVRNFLFGAPGQGGFDLAALNVQRGRDHGLADYNTVRAAYGLPRLTSFSQVTADAGLQAALAQAYGSVDRIDLWVGGLAEPHLPGSSLGATFTRIIVDQFTRLRDGDRFWYENSLPAAKIGDIQGVSLATIIRRNTTLTNVQPDVFFFRASIGGTVFADGNRDSIRQSVEPGLAAVAVSLIAADGTTVATTRTDARGGFAFSHLDLGTYGVVVATTGGGTVTGATAAVTRGGAFRVDVGVAPPPAPKPKPKPAAPPPSTAGHRAFATLWAGPAEAASPNAGSITSGGRRR